VDAVLAAFTRYFEVKKHANGVLASTRGSGLPPGLIDSLSGTRA
jgi:hypothetical protein